MLKAGQDMWTSDEIDHLISLVRAKDILYNQALPGYSNRDMTEQAWYCIGQKLKKSALSCTKKWQILRAGYRKRRHEYDMLPPNAKRSKKWTYYDSLSFLEDHIVLRNTMNNSTISPEKSTHDDDETMGLEITPIETNNIIPIPEFDDDDDDDESISQDIWTREEIYHLIALVRSKEILYNAALPGYSNREMTERAWNKISAKVRKSAVACTKKWQILRSGFRKRRHDYQNLPLKSHKWSYYDSLVFLEDHIAMRPTFTTALITKQEEESNSDGSMCMIDESSIIGLHQDADEEPRSSSVTGEKHCKCCAKGEMASYLEYAKDTPREPRSSIEHFLMSLVEEVEDLPLSAQRTFKIKTLQLIEQLSSTAYEKNSH